MQPLLAAFAAWLIKESPFWVPHTEVEIDFMFNYTEIEFMFFNCISYLLTNNDITNVL